MKGYFAFLCPPAVNLRITFTYIRYVDKMLEMIAVAGDFVAGAVWHRIIQIVTNHKELQAYAADRLFVTLRSKRAHETAVSVGGYILGEFGYFIAEQASCFWGFARELSM